VQQGEDQGGVPLLADERVPLQELAQFLLGGQPALEHADPAHAAQQHRGERQGEAVRLGLGEVDRRVGLEREGGVVEIRQRVGDPLGHPPGPAVRQHQAQAGQLLADLLRGQLAGLGQALERLQLAGAQIEQGVGQVLVVLQVEDHGLQQAHAPVGPILPLLGQRQFAARTDDPELFVGAVGQQLVMRKGHGASLALPVPNDRSVSHEFTKVMNEILRVLHGVCARTAPPADNR